MKSWEKIYIEFLVKNAILINSEMPKGWGVLTTPPFVKSSKITKISKSTEISESTEKDNSSKWIIGSIAIVVTIWLLYPLAIGNLNNFFTTDPIQLKLDYLTVNYNNLIFSNIEDLEEKIPEELNGKFELFGSKFGTFGDSYGALNTLFSGLAFAVLIVSMILQRLELKEQRKELKAQREEISKSNVIAEQQKLITDQQAKLIKQQVLDAQRQNFNEIFFKYLEEKNDKEKNLKIGTSNLTRGGECFEKYRENLVSYLISQHYQFDTIQDEISRHSVLKNLLISEFLQREAITKYTFNRSGYFHFYIFIINFLEKNADIIDVNDYVEILLSYATQDELVCLVWYGLLHIELNTIIKKYSIHRKISYISYPKIFQYVFPLFD